VPEYEFNLKLADVIAQSLREVGFDKTVRLVTSGGRTTSLFERAASANHLNADLFISIHHDSVPDNLKEKWQYEGKKLSYSDQFSGYAVFVSNDNADRAGSFAFGHSLGQELQKRGLHYTPHYTLPLMGRYRHELVDEEAGVYRYDYLIVLHSTRMPAVLLEAGSIIKEKFGGSTWKLFGLQSQPLELPARSKRSSDRPIFLNLFGTCRAWEQ